MNPLNEEVRRRIDSVAASASPEEVAAVEKLVARAEAAKKETDILTITPAMAALIFLKFNGWNRGWRGRKVLEYARRMRSGMWQWNGQGIVFYDSGNLGDGQHRLGGAAVGGYTWTVNVAFGVPNSAVDTIDDGVARSGSDHASMDQLKDTKPKQSILKAAAAYFGRLSEPIPFESLESAAELHQAIKKHDKMLTLAISIGDASPDGCSAPSLKRPEAARTAFVMLYGGYPEKDVVHVLKRIQEGVALDSEGGENAGVYRAREILDARQKGKTLQTAKQIGLVVKAAVMLRTGTKSSRRVMQSEVEKELPSPIYVPPAPSAVQAAE